MSVCEEQFNNKLIDVGYTTKFDDEQGMAIIMGGEACWSEIIDKIEEADGFLDETIAMAEENGMDLEKMGYPTHADYVEMRDKVSSYTAGDILMTSWKWDMEAVTPGQSAGLCIGEPEPSTAYWSCWSFTMLEDGTYPKNPASYLIDPATWTATSSLDTQEDITEGIFPAMYGGWMCQSPKEWEGNMYSDCMRFLPSEEYSTASNSTDVRFEAGPMQIATYLSSRATADSEGEVTDVLTAEESMFELYSIDMSDHSESGAWAGISAVGFALASVFLMAF